MVIDFNRTAAYMCPGCGCMTFGTFSLFELSGGRGITVSCGCGKSHLHIFPKTKTEYEISLRCIVCEEEHAFLVPLHDMMKQPCIGFTCPDILIGLCYIGKQEEVAEAVQENERYIHDIVSACGLEHTGKNGITMLKALDKIQELSEEGDLSCECGSTRIDVDVLENELILECCNCGGEAVFTADEIRNGHFSEVTEIVIQKAETPDKK